MDFYMYEINLHQSNLGDTLIKAKYTRSTKDYKRLHFM